MWRLVPVLVLAGCGVSAAPGDGSPSAGPDAASMDGGTPGRDGSAPDVSAAPDAGPPVRVLFVGNSYTYFNDLPGVVRDLGGATPGVGIEVDSVTAGGARLADHWSSTGARERIRMEGFDAVVLQGQSLEAVSTPDDFDLHAERFAGELRDAGAAGVWFATWARRDVEADPLVLMEWIEERYQAAAAHNGDAVARVGAAWEIALLELPDVTLFAPDRSHPSPEGTLLASCVIFEALTGLAPELPEPPPLGLSADVAGPLCAIADEGVPCDPAESLCDEACVAWDTDDCGGCGVACAEGDPCRDGICGCPDGLTGCDERCTRLMTDEMNCGACGEACALGSVCEDGACACPSSGRIDLFGELPMLTSFDPGCDAWGDAGTPACNAAAHGYCEAVGAGDGLDCFTTGLGPPSGHAPMPRVVMCVDGDVRTTTYTELQTFVPSCDGVGERIGPNCATAIHRYCADAGAVSGVGPIGDGGGDPVTVTCLEDATVVPTTMGELAGFASRCTADPVTCSVAAWSYCESLGHAAGFGPVETSGSDVDVVCVDDP